MHHLPGRILLGLALLMPPVVGSSAAARCARAPVEAHRPVRRPPTFTVVPLGVKGGLDESNLSAYLVAAAGTEDFLCLDAGTVQVGVRRAIRRGSLRGPAEQFIRQRIRAYYISHPHVDHVAGLLLNAPDDAPKPIFGLSECLTVLQRDYFNWQAWPNFGDAGPAPSLRKYQLTALMPGQETTTPTGLTVQAFPLSHGPGYQSTAFLLRHGPAALLYLGDTGADAVEHTTHLHELWQAVAPLLAAGQLRGIFVEAS